MTRFSPSSIWIGSLLLWGAWAGCRTEPVTWRVPGHNVILLQDTLNWADLVPDTLWEEGEEGLRLTVEATRPLLDATALVPEFDTAWTDNFTLPFGGGPIPVAPGTPIWNEEETVPLDVPQAGLRRARLDGGVLRLQVSSTVQGPLSLVYEFEGAEFPEGTNGGEASIELLVDADTAEVVLDLTGVVLDLDGPQGLQYSRLATSWSVGVPADAAEPVGVFGSDALSLTVELSGLSVAQVEGRFDAQSLNVADILDIGAGEGGLQSLEVGWMGLEVDLTLRNTAGLDLRTTLNALQRIDSADGAATTTPLQDDALGTPVWLGRAELTGTGDMNAWSVAPTEATFQFSSDQGNLSGFLGSMPDALAWDVDLEVNPLGDVTGGYDRVDLTRLPEARIQVEAPLAVSASRAVWVDTLDIVPPDWLDYSGFLDLEVESALPVGATAQLQLVDLPESMTLFDDFLGPGWLDFADVVLIPGSGDPLAPTTTVSRVDMIQPHFEALRLGARLRVEVAFETPEAGATFNTAQRVVLRGHLDGDAQISVE